MMPLTKRMSLPLSPRQQNQLTRSPRSKRRISVDDVLCANLGHTAKSLCSPSHYATKRIDETAFDNNVENNREAETFLGGLLSEAPTPSRVARPITRQSQCLQGFSYSPADIMIDSRRQRRHASMPEKSSPRHLMVAQSPKGEKEKDGVNFMEAHAQRACEWKKLTNSVSKKERLVTPTDWTAEPVKNTSSTARSVPAASAITTPTKTPASPVTFPSTPSTPLSPPIAPLTPPTQMTWAPNVHVNSYYSMDQQQQQQQQNMYSQSHHHLQQSPMMALPQQNYNDVTAMAAAALWQQRMMYQQMLLSQQHLHQNNMNSSNFNYMSSSTITQPRSRSSRPRSNSRGRYNSSSNNKNYDVSLSSSSLSTPLNRGNSLLENWKNSENRKAWALAHIVGHLKEFAQDTAGTHFLQSCLDESKKMSNSQEIINVYIELDPSMSGLLLHNTGNWSVKKLVELLPAHELEGFFKNHIIGKVNSLAYHVHGARVLKAALIHAAELKTCTLKTFALNILDDLSSDLVRAMCHESATHIFQRSFNVLNTYDERKLIVEKLILCGQNNSGDLQRIGTHTYGSRALQCLIGTCAELMASTILQLVPSLAQSAAGNFVLQSMLQNGNSKTRMNLVKASTYHLGQFACNKHASHFVERCIDMASEEELTMMVNAMSSPPPGSSTAAAAAAAAAPVMVMMCNNNYGNFVVGSIVSRLQHTGQNGLKIKLSKIMESWEQQMRATNVGDKTYNQSMAALMKGL
jgi:hypothetical protein